MRRGRRKINKCSIAAIVSSVFVVIVVVCVVWIEKRIEPKLREICSNYCEMKLSQVMSESVENVIHSENIKYEEIALQNEADGKLSSISINTEYVNKLQSEVLNLISEKLNNSETEMVIPLGNISDTFLLNGHGPDVRVKLLLNGAVDSDIESNFETAGINQTCHILSMKLSAKATVVLPSESIPIKADITCPIAQNIIIGDIPDVFLNNY